MKHKFFQGEKRFPALCAKPENRFFEEKNALTVKQNLPHADSLCAGRQNRRQLPSYWYFMRTEH